MNRYKLIVFDWDGTLVDSVDHIVDSLIAASFKMQLSQRNRDEYASIIGLGMHEAIQSLYPELCSSYYEDFKGAYSDAFFAKQNMPSDIFPGVLELLSTLESSGMHLAIATGKSRKGLDAALGSTGLNNFFAVSRCANETRSKPDPLMLEELMAHFGCDRSETLMIGDSIYDLKMARSAGVDCIGVAFGACDAKVLSAYQPISVIEEMSELLKYL